LSHGEKLLIPNLIARNILLILGELLLPSDTLTVRAQVNERISIFIYSNYIYIPLQVWIFREKKKKTKVATPITTAANLSTMAKAASSSDIRLEKVKVHGIQAIRGTVKTKDVNFVTRFEQFETSLKEFIKELTTTQNAGKEQNCHTATPSEASSNLVSAHVPSLAQVPKAGEWRKLGNKPERGTVIQCRGKKGKLRVTIRRIKFGRVRNVPYKKRGACVLHLN